VGDVFRLADRYHHDFGFSLGAPAANLLVPALDHAEWTTTPLEWNVPGCDRAPMTAPQKKDPVRGGLAAAALADRFVPLLEDNLLAMLADVPAPLRSTPRVRGLRRTSRAATPSSADSGSSSTADSTDADDAGYTPSCCP
jgi:hypothetical protein